MTFIPKAYEIYRHFKGNLYQIIAVAAHSETGEQLVIYQALYGDYQIYARPLVMFGEKVDKRKYPQSNQEYRFEIWNGEKPETVVTENAEQKQAEPMPVQSGITEPETAEQKSMIQEEKDTLMQEELNIDPMVWEFLDADSYGARLNILVGLRHRITDEMITTMAIASDVEVPEGDVEERYEALRDCLVTKEKYECNRLR